MDNQKCIIRDRWNKMSQKNNKEMIFPILIYQKMIDAEREIEIGRDEIIEYGEWSAIGENRHIAMKMKDIFNNAIKQRKIVLALIVSAKSDKNDYKRWFVRVKEVEEDKVTVNLIPEQERWPSLEQFVFVNTYNETGNTLDYVVKSTQNPFGYICKEENFEVATEIMSM